MFHIFYFTEQIRISEECCLLYIVPSWRHVCIKGVRYHKKQLVKDTFQLLDHTSRQRVVERKLPVENLRDELRPFTPLDQHLSNLTFCVLNLRGQFF
jgi:hypothetical protein